MTIGTLCSTLILLASCSREQPQPGVFHYNAPNGIGTLDPAQSSYQAATWAGTQLFNGLVELDSALRVAPCIARSWEIDSTRTLYTFYLRNDVWFHTNRCFGKAGTRRVTASDVKYSFERICNARTRSTGLWVFRKRIPGVESYYEATAAGGKTGGVEGLEVVNDTTFRVRLLRPYAPFLSVLTMPYGWIVPREAVETYGEDFSQNPVGTGPFMLQRWTADRELTLRRNPRYFKRDNAGRRLPYLDGVRISFMRDTKTEFFEFQKGRLDMVGTVDPSFAPSVLTPEGRLRGDFRKRFVLLTAPMHSIEYYGILLDTGLAAARTSPLATNRYLRQALNFAINRERIIRYVLRGKGIPAHNGVLPPSMPGFSNTIIGYEYNPDTARTLLARAGYPNGKGLPTLVLQLGNDQRTASVAEAVQEQWREIGVSVDLRQVDFPQHLDMVRSGKLALWRTNWLGDYPDPENFLALFYSPFRSPGGPNTTRITIRALDSLYDAALEAPPATQQRFDLYNEMERKVIEESPWIFLYYNTIQRLVQPSIKGLTVDGTDRLVLERVRKTVQ